MPRDYLMRAAERAALLACCCGWLECDMPVGPAKETGKLVNKNLPGGLAGENLVTAAGKLDVAGTADSRGDKASFAGGNDRLVARMDDESGAADPG
jgi:hypothetical protein